jgi:hypothetical protein
MGQDIMRGPHKVHAQYPADPQPYKKPHVSDLLHDSKTLRARERKGEYPVQVDKTSADHASNCDLNREEK